MPGLGFLGPFVGVVLEKGGREGILALIGLGNSFITLFSGS